MRYAILGDRLHRSGQPVPYLQTKHMGGRIVPALVILHDTAGRLTKGNDAKYLTNNERQVSAHLVVETDGTVTQLAPFDRRTNHAYPSKWRGRDGCNGYAVGIEIVNPGKLVPKGGDKAVAWFGETFSGCQKCTSQAHGGEGWWLPYTKEQRDAVAGILAALGKAYPGIKEVVGHHDVSPGRKVDPTPLMDWRVMRQALAGASPVEDEPAPTPAPSLDVASAQARLRALGYFAGPPDGDLGPRTEAALFAFQRQNALRATGKLDTATAWQLEQSDAKAMPTGPREEMTEAEIVQKSVTAQEAASVKSDGNALTFVGVITTILAALTSMAQAFKEFVAAYGEIALLVIGLGALWFGWRNKAKGLAIIKRRLADHQSGAHQGL